MNRRESNQSINVFVLASDRHYHSSHIDNNDRKSRHVFQEEVYAIHRNSKHRMHLYRREFRK